MGIIKIYYCLTSCRSTFINRLNPATFLCLSQARIWIYITTSCRGLFCAKWVELGGDCLFCWYWWNCWPSLFKLSFHNFFSNRTDLHKNYRNTTDGQEYLAITPPRLFT